MIKENYLNEIKYKWLAAKTSFPSFLTAICKDIKASNEQYIIKRSDDFQKQLKNFSINPIKKHKWKQKTQNLLMDVLYTETIIGLHTTLDNSTIDAVQEELKNFLRHVREFAPELTMEEIGQAARNYIVYVMFNELNKGSSGFNSAGFGYSMLYPFTDNYIDNKNYTNKEKADYNQLIRDKIEGKEVHPKSLHQIKTCHLLQAIEEQYPRDKDSSIFTLLLMILEAQENSMQQQQKGFLLSAEERMDISIYKGSISVLIDRFFVNKEITDADLIFYLGFGFFLQLADDLQDIKEDSEQGNQTIFTLDLHTEYEEQLVNKLLQFIHQLMNDYKSENDAFKDFILSNCYQLIYTSVVGSNEFFSKEYLSELENYLPVTYAYLEKMKKCQFDSKDIKTSNKYMKILDELIY